MFLLRTWQTNIHFIQITLPPPRALLCQGISWIPEAKPRPFPFQQLRNAVHVDTPPRAFRGPTMHVATVSAWGSPPQYTTAPDLAAPGPSQLRLKILVAAVHRFVQA